jgi:predicted Zn-dependent protease
MTEIILAAVTGALVGAFLTWLFLSRQRSQQADTFNSLAAQALQANSQGFLQLAQQSLQGFQERAKGDLDQRTQAVEQLVSFLFNSHYKKSFIGFLQTKTLETR